MRTHSDIARVCICATAWRYQFFCQCHSCPRLPFFMWGVCWRRGTHVLFLLACAKTACAHKRARNISVLANLPNFNQFSYKSHAQNGGVVHQRCANAQNYVLVLLWIIFAVFISVVLVARLRGNLHAQANARKFTVLANLPYFD